MSSRGRNVLEAVLGLKFMKKSKERIETDVHNTQDHESLYSNIITKEMRHATGNYIQESSYVFCEDLIEGRVSFNGMNTEIERLMSIENEKNKSNVGEMQKDISDEDLAEKFKASSKRKLPFDSPAQTTMVKKRRK